MNRKGKVRKNVTTACKNCRRRKSRCTGERICDRCHRHSLNCEYPDSSKRGPPRRDVISKVTHNEVTGIDVLTMTEICDAFNSSEPNVFDSCFENTSNVYNNYFLVENPMPSLNEINNPNIDPNFCVSPFTAMQ